MKFYMLNIQNKYYYEIFFKILLMNFIYAISLLCRILVMSSRFIEFWKKNTFLFNVERKDILLMNFGISKKFVFKKDNNILANLDLYAHTQKKLSKGHISFETVIILTIFTPCQCLLS